jgi:hypothetical protein
MKKSGIFPKWNMVYIQNIFKDYSTDTVNKEIAVLIKIGEEFINKARIYGEYTDRTGNLRSSIGYVLVHNGNILNQNVQGLTQEGKAAAEEQVKLLSERYKGLVLIGFAGMEYAAAVEAKGFDVITQSAPTRKILKDAFKKYLK